MPDAPLDLDSLAPVALIEYDVRFFVATAGETATHAAIPFATYAALVAELRAARERENAVREVLAAISTETGCPTGTGFDDGCDTCRWLMDLHAAIAATVSP